MTLHPEDYRYWAGWLIAGFMARWFLVEPIIRAIKRGPIAPPWISPDE